MILLVWKHQKGFDVLFFFGFLNKNRILHPYSLLIIHACWSARDNSVQAEFRKA